MRVTLFSCGPAAEDTRFEQPELEGGFRRREEGSANEILEGKIKEERLSPPRGWG